MKYEISLDENIFLTDVNITVVFLVDVLSRDGSGSLRHVTRLLLQLLELSEQLGGVLSCGIDVFLQLLVFLKLNVVADIWSSTFLTIFEKPICSSSSTRDQKDDEC